MMSTTRRKIPTKRILWVPNKIDNLIEDIDAYYDEDV
jgi:hypothetical protein